MILGEISVSKNRDNKRRAYIGSTCCKQDKRGKNTETKKYNHDSVTALVDVLHTLQTRQYRDSISRAQRQHIVLLKTAIYEIWFILHAFRLDCAAGSTKNGYFRTYTKT